jgi:AcrR family transcriptional regulator
MVAARQLSQQGYGAMSLASVAAEAGTTRQALYRRWPGKAALASTVIGAMAVPEETTQGGHDPFSELVAELEDFRRGVSRRGRISLVGTMLQDATDASVVRRYRDRVVAPRRRRLRAILERARDQGWIDSDADIEIAVTMCTGSWYATALAGTARPTDWPRRTASLVWSALGGRVPTPSPRPRADA